MEKPRIPFLPSFERTVVLTTAALIFIPLLVVGALLTFWLIGVPPQRRMEFDLIVFYENKLIKCIFVVVAVLLALANLVLIIKSRRILSLVSIPFIVVPLLILIMLLATMLGDYNNEIHLGGNFIYFEQSNSGIIFADLDHVENEKQLVYRWKEGDSWKLLFKLIMGGKLAEAPPSYYSETRYAIRFVRKNPPTEALVVGSNSILQFAMPDIVEAIRKSGIQVRDTTVVVREP